MKLDSKSKKKRSMCMVGRRQQPKNADETSLDTHKKSMVKIMASLEDCFACCTAVLLSCSQREFLSSVSEVLEFPGTGQTFFALI